MKPSICVQGMVMLLFLPLVLPGQEAGREESKLDLTQHYLVLETRNISTTQKELSEVAAADYRALARSGPHILVLEKLGQPLGKYEYFLPDPKIGCQKGLDEGAAKGFRVHPRTIGVLGGVLMEKAPNPQNRYQYLVLKTKRISTLQKELEEASQKGYGVAGIGVEELDYALIMEKLVEMPGEIATPPAEKSPVDLRERYLILETSKTSAMKKELNEASAKGYRVVASSASQLIMILEKLAAPSDASDYLLLATTRTSALQKELNEAAATGFRLLPRTLARTTTGVTFAFGMGRGSEMVAVMEKAPGSQKQYEYLVLATARTSTLQKELSVAR